MGKTITEKQKIIGIDDPVSYLEVTPYALQHFSRIWHIPFSLPILFTIIFSWQGFGTEQAASMIAIGFIASGINMLLQANRFSSRVPFIGSHMIVYLPVLIAMVGMAGVPTAFLGISISYFITTLLSIPTEKHSVIGRLVPIFSAPVVSGSFLTFLGIALTFYVAIPNTFGRAPFYYTGWTLTSNIIIFVTVFFFTMILWFGLKPTGTQGVIRALMMLISLIFGIIVAAALGRTDFSAVAAAPWFSAPKLFLGFSLPSPINMSMLGSIIITGIIANLAGLADTGAVYASTERLAPGHPKMAGKRVNRGFFFQMLWNGIAALFGTWPMTGYAQHNVYNELTGCWSYKQSQIVGVLMIISGLIYKVGMFGASIPTAVQGALTLTTTMLIVMAGLKILKLMEWTQRNLATAGVSMAVGMFTLTMPAHFIDALPPIPKVFFGSSILVAFVTAILLYVFLTLIPKRLKGSK